MDARRYEHTVYVCTVHYLRVHYEPSKQVAVRLSRL